MAEPLPPKPLPERPSLTQLRRLARERLDQLRAGDPGARLFQAQLDVARQHGHASWRTLVAAVPPRPALATPAAGDLMAAVVRGDDLAIRRLLTADRTLATALMAHPFWGGRPQALHVAVERGQATCVAALLTHGADPDGDNDGYDGWSPLLLAIHWKHAAIAEALRAGGARVGMGEALLAGDDAALDALLSADPTIVEREVPNFGTPLHFATTEHAARRLLDLGVNPYGTDKYGKTALDAAAGRKPPARAVLTLLRRHTGAAADAGQLAATGDLPGLQACLAADPTQRERRFTVQWTGQPLLHIASEHGQVEVVRWLLASGTAIDLPGVDRQSALHAAAWSGQLAVVQALVEAGADLGARDERYHNTPLGWARTNRDTLSRPGCAEVVAWLEARGAQ